MRLLFALLLLPALASAQSLIRPWQVLSSVTNDWNEDGWMDRAVLGYAPDDGETVLWIYQGGDTGFALVAEARGMIGIPAGEVPPPDMFVTERGSLQIISESDAGGRNFWSEVITIAYRKGKFVVAGYTSTNYDTINPSLTGTCDVNFLARKGELTDADEQTTAFTLDTPATPVDRWSIAGVPDACYR